MARVSASIDHLELTWRSLDELLAGLDEAQWKTPTGCPGWTVQDNVSHLIDFEAAALGRPRPDHTPADLSHTKNELGAANEIGVDFRRSHTGAEVLREYRDVMAARLAQLERMTEADLQREVPTPAGPGTMQSMLTLRVQDTWSHEQDIRRALGIPGHLDGPAVEESVGYWVQFLPLIVGKRAAAPEGATVVIDVVGVRRVAIEVVDGRARFTDDQPASPTVALRVSPGTFGALVGGRADAPDDVEISGDDELGRRIVGALGFLP